MTLAGANILGRSVFHWQFNARLICMLLHFDTCCWSPKIQRTADGSCHLPTTLLATCWRGSAEKCARYSQSLVPVVELANQACHHLSSDPGQLTSREENVCHAQPLWFCPDDQDQEKKLLSLLSHALPFPGQYSHGSRLRVLK